MSNMSPASTPHGLSSPAEQVSVCCHAENHCMPEEPHGHGHAAATGWIAASSVTLHCLMGCAIGEWTGLAIAVTLGLGTHAAIALAVILSFVSGFGLSLKSLLARGQSLSAAMRIVWIGELVSITAMEIAMNLVDYYMGGMRRGMSIFSSNYWFAFVAATVAGYLATLPVNYQLLRRNLKNCH